MYNCSLFYYLIKFFKVFSFSHYHKIIKILYYNLFVIINNKIYIPGIEFVGGVMGYSWVNLLNTIPRKDNNIKTL